MKDSKHLVSNEEVIPRKNFEAIMASILQDEKLAQRLFNAFEKEQRGYLNFTDYAEGVGIIMKGTLEEKLALCTNMISESTVDGNTLFIWKISG